MTEQQTPLTYEGILELMRENERKFVLMTQESERRSQETDRKFQETDRKFRETDKKISELGSRIDAIVENMLYEDIISQFQALGYNIDRSSRRFRFAPFGTEECNEVDLYLQDNDIAILINAKTTLTNADVLEHIERLEKYRRCMDAAGSDSRRFIGAVAGAVVEDNVAAFAQKHGMYVIAQSGKAFEIVPSPEGFVPKKW